MSNDDNECMVDDGSLFFVSRQKRSYLKWDASIFGIWCIGMRCKCC